MKKLRMTAVGLLLTLLATPVSAAKPFYQVEHRQSIEEYFHEYTYGFLDTEGHWAKEQIYEAVDLGYVSGTSETTFSPDVLTTRAMLVTILYRMAGQPEVEGESSYTDVPKGHWCEKAVLWTEEKLIAYSESETEFGVNGTATREQIITMLYRYARTMGYDVSKYEDTTIFSDSDAISATARGPVAWAVANKLVSGKEGNRFAPNDSATRAEVVAIMMRFLHLNEGEQ